MELSRISLIRNSKLDDLKNADYLEKLMCSLGFNTEILWEQPEIVKNHGGGLRIWQYPNQFSNYLCLLNSLNIKSFIEVGCRWGGTFVLTNEYLKRFNPITKSVAVDIIDSPVVDYCMMNDETQFIKVNSTSEQFRDYMKRNFFDMIFIDGDHTYEGVSKDYEICKHSGRVFVFHDIINDACPGVVQLWNELKSKESDKYDFFEFTEQYDDVWASMHKKYLGIGVAVRK